MAWDTTTTPKNASPDVSAVPGTLCVLGGSEDSTTTLSTPTGGGLTYTLRQSVVVSGKATAYGWTAPVASSQTYTLQGSRGGSTLWWGILAMMFSGSDGVGASSSTNAGTGGPSLTFTTTGNNSAICMVVTDWNASSTAPTYRTPSGSTAFTQLLILNPGTNYSAFVGYYSDVGAAGSKTIGISSPSMNFSIAGIEILGSAGAPPTSRPIFLRERLPMGALLQL
jgi:hypothetical protein